MKCTTNGHSELALSQDKIQQKNFNSGGKNEMQEASLNNQLKYMM